VWSAIDDVGSHVEWMADAVAIRFRGDQRAGAGTTFECDTKVGPLSLTDIMEISSWKPGREMGVRHVGLVRGSGRFTLDAVKGGTRFTWRERLTFPWWLGGSLGAVVGGEVLRLVWRKNLRNLKRLVEAR
jgi:hypothetical protein